MSEDMLVFARVPKHGAIYPLGQVRHSANGTGFLWGLHVVRWSIQIPQRSCRSGNSLSDSTEYVLH